MVDVKIDAKFYYFFQTIDCLRYKMLHPYLNLPRIVGIIFQKPRK
jgi:hypothetical protein